MRYLTIALTKGRLADKTLELFRKVGIASAGADDKETRKLIFTNEEMRTDFQTHWSVTCPAVLKVKKPGGLAQGYHDLKYGFCFTSSYMPPIIQDNLDPDKEGFVFMPEFGHHVNERRLLIV